MSALVANPWPHVAFAALHLVAGQVVAAAVYRARFGGSPLVIYRAPGSSPHGRRSRLVAAATVGWAGAFLACAFSPGFRATWPGTALFEVPPVAGWVVGAIGLIGMVAAQFTMGASFRVGLDEGETPHLITDGLHAWSRNPIYVASVIYLVGVSLWAPCLAVLAALLAIGIGIHSLVRAEESFLARTVGAPFETYRARVRRYL